MGRQWLAGLNWLVLAAGGGGGGPEIQALDFLHWLTQLVQVRAGRVQCLLGRARRRLALPDSPHLLTAPAHRLLSTPLQNALTHPILSPPGLL